MKNRLIELEERILDRTASDAEVIEYDDLKNARTVFKAAKQTVQEFKGSLPVKHTQPVGHTQGPWSIRADSTSEIVNCIGSPLARLAGSRDEWEANARLIAAAPDLLEALKYVRNLAETGLLLSEEGKPVETKYLDEVIAKATNGGGT